MFLSLISKEISRSMSQLFNNLLENGHFPDLWKISHITPIYKKSGLKSAKENFRPISLLPTISKIFESIIHERLSEHCFRNNIISERQAAYLKGDSTIHQLLYIVHKIRTNWTKNMVTHGLFLDVSAAFDKVWHSGLIAKLEQIGVNGNCLETLVSYLSHRKQVVVVDGSKSDILSVNSGVPQGSRLGPLLFIIYMNDIINDIESDILIFADDTSLFASAVDPAETTAILNRDLTKIAIWADKWKITFNAKKSKDMIFSNKFLNNSPSLNFNDKQIERVNSHKHLGLVLTSTLDWGSQVEQVCLKANRKLTVLRTVKFLNKQTLDVSYKLTVRSIVDYALPIYCNSLRQTELRRFEDIQYKAAKLVTGALHLTSKEKLNSELGWETIKCRANLLGLNIFHKIHRNETRPLVKKCMPEMDLKREHLLRSNGGYLPFKSYNCSFKKSFFPYFSKIWNNLDKGSKSKNLQDFKIYTKDSMKPPRYKFYSRGNKYSNTLLTRIRVGRSCLNQHRFVIGKINSPECHCHFKEESPQHYFLDCFLYSLERQYLFDLIEHYIPNFKKLNKKCKLDIIMNGLERDNTEYFHLNTTLTLAVQLYILKTKRFEQ